MSGEKRSNEVVDLSLVEFDFQKEKHLVLTDILTQKVQVLADLGIGLVSEPRDLVKKTLRVIDFFDISEDFFLSEHGRIRPFILLGAVDQWMQSEDLDESKGLFDVIKILCFDESNTIGGYTFSSRVGKQDEDDNRLGYEFTGSPRSVNSLVWKERNEYARVHEDIQATSKLAYQLSITLGDQSPLSAIRKRLGVTVYNEAPFSVVVLKKTVTEMAEELNGTLAFFSRGRLCVPSDFNLHLIEHEYIHSQQSHFSLGPNGSLGRGLLEAWTEYQTQSPVYYENQRNVLAVVVHHLPSFLKALTQQDLEQSSEAIDEMYFHLLSRFGTGGLLSLLRMESASECAENSDEYHGKYVFISADLVPDLLDQSVVEGPIEERVAQLTNKAQVNEDDNSLYKLKMRKAEADGNTKQQVEISKKIAKIQLVNFLKGDPNDREGNLNFRLAYKLYLEQYMQDPDLTSIFVSEIQKRCKSDSQQISLTTVDLLFEIFAKNDVYGPFLRLLFALNKSAGRDRSWVEAFETEVHTQLFERTNNLKVAYFKMSKLYFKYKESAESERGEELVNTFLTIAERLALVETSKLDVYYLSKILRFVAKGIGVSDSHKAEVYPHLVQLLQRGEKFLEDFGHTLDEFDTDDTQQAFKHVKDLLSLDFWSDV